MPSEASLLIPGCGEGKCQHLCKAPDKESRQLVLKNTNSQLGSGECFQGQVREGDLRICDQLMQEKGLTEDEMVGCHHQLDGRGFEWTPGVGDGQGGLAYCSSWGRKELDTTEQLN